MAVLSACMALKLPVPQKLGRARCGTPGQKAPPQELPHFSALLTCAWSREDELMCPFLCDYNIEFPCSVCA